MEPRDHRSIQIEWNWDEWARLTIVNHRPHQRISPWPLYTREQRELSRRASAMIRADADVRAAYWEAIRWGKVETDLQRDARLTEQFVRTGEAS
jgi:hypothetical protein